MDSFFTFLIIIVISALATWLKKKTTTPGLDDQSADPTEAPPPVNRPGQPRPMAPSRPVPRATSWEEELRRLLEGQSPSAPPLARPSPPVVVAQPQSMPPARP